MGAYVTFFGAPQIVGPVAILVLWFPWPLFGAIVGQLFHRAERGFWLGLCAELFFLLVAVQFMIQFSKAEATAFELLKCGISP